MSWNRMEAARYDEMSGKRRSLHLTLGRDSDLVLTIDFDGVPICDENGNEAKVEFCSLSGGGGQSPEVRRALSDLMLAIVQDNRKDPTGVPKFPIYIAERMERIELPDDPVLFYEREFYAFSNFSSFAVWWKDRLWMTSEHAYHAEKFTDRDLIEQIYQARSAHDALKIAHAHNELIRPDWEAVKIEVMEAICRAKLEQHPYIQKLLRRTGTRLIIENSSRDAFWGWGPDKDGRNELGKIWMKLRAELPPE